MKFNKEVQAEERQKVLDWVLRLNKTKRLLVLQEATGVGKGLQVMKCIEEDDSSKKWLILVPEVLQIENMKADIEKHGMQHLYSKIEDIICYASFPKYEGGSYNIHANEGHRLSNLRMDVLQSIDFDRIIVDSATIPFRVRKLLEQVGRFFYYKLSLSEAIERGILPEPRVYKVGIELDSKVKRNPATYGKVIHMVTDAKYAEKMDGDLEYWKKRFIEEPEAKWISGKLNSIGNERKKWFAHKKTDILRKLLERIKGKRYICFTGSVEQCNEIGGDKAVHSKKSRKHNIATLDAFNNGDIDDIYMNKMGREGLNLEDILAAIITQLGTGSDEGLEFLQSTGRALRSITPEVYLPYIRNTKDEDFLNKALKNIDKEYIEELEIS